MKKLLRQLSLLVEAISELAEVKACEFEWFRSHCEFATKQDLKIMEHKIMSAISEFAVRQNAFNNRIDTAIEGLTGDVQVLVAKIEELQNTVGQITPEDQALLDAIQSRSDAIAAKLEALDALTPPPVPVA